MGRLITSLRCLLYTRPDIVGICVCVVLAGLIGVGFTGVWSSVRNSLVSLVDDLAGDAPSVDEDPIMVLTGGKASMADMEDRWAYALGLTDYETGHLFGAIAEFDRAIQLNPQYGMAYIYRGLSKAGLGHDIEAIPDYDAAIQLNPRDGIASLAYYFRGLAKSALGQYHASIEDYDAAIRLKPDIADFFNSRGVAKVELDRYFGAIVDFDTAIRLNPDDPKAYYNRGFAKENLGHSDAASADYETAIRLKPNYDEIGDNRASAKSEAKEKNVEEIISKGERMLQDLIAKSNLEQSPAASPDNGEETKPELERNHAAPSSIDRATQIDPNYDKAIHNGTLASHEVQLAF